MAIVMGPTTKDTLRRQHGHSNDLQCLRQAFIHERARKEPRRHAMYGFLSCVCSSTLLAPTCLKLFRSVQNVPGPAQIRRKSLGWKCLAKVYRLYDYGAPNASTR